MASGNKFDLRHKETLKLFLKEYFELFFPDLVDKIRFETAKFIDKELIALFANPKEAGEDRDRDNETDALILVEALIADKPEMILFHWEQQGEKKMTHNERMFHYFCGIYYKFRKPIFPISMFTDQAKWRISVPDTYSLEVFGRKIAIYGYQSIKLKDYKAEEFEEKARDNPLAAAYLPLTDYPVSRRAEIKAKAVKGISKVEKGKKRATLYSLIDASLVLNGEEEKQYRELIRNDPEYKEVKMLESIEEVGIEKGIDIGIDKGIDIGIDKGIDKGKLIGEIRMGQRILKMPLSSSEALKTKSVDELIKILAEVEARLNLDS